MSMYASSVADIENAFLHDAALVLEARGFKLRSLYMDSSGECAISYYGHLTEQQIKEVMINFCYPGQDKTYDEIHPQLHTDYVYSIPEGKEKEYTQIYTPNGLDYRKLIKVELSGPFTSKDWEEVALLTKKEGCSDKNVEWAKQHKFSDFTFDRETAALIKGKFRRVIIFKVDKHMSTEALNEATSMDGWYFRKINGQWDYRK